MTTFDAASGARVSSRPGKRTAPFAAFVWWIVGEIEAEQSRWFLWLPVAFGLGIAAYFALMQEPGLAAMTALAAGAGAAHVLGRRAGLLGLVTGACLAMALGALTAKLRSDYMAAPILLRQVGPVEVRGWVELVEPRPTKGQRVTLQLVSMGELAPEHWPHRVRIRTRASDGVLTPGMMIRIKATLAGPAPPSLPGDFDFGRMAWFSALGGIGLSQSAAVIETPLGDPPISVVLRAAIERVRQHITNRIMAALPGEQGAIAAALITGERGAITDATNQAYRDSGLFHILSISGLHMVIMAGAVFYALRLLLAAVPAIALNYPIKKWAAVGAIIGALGYLLISGASPATVRSYITITIIFVAVLLDRPAIALRNVALSALAILVVFPEYLFDAGFQMSYAAVVALISIYEWLQRRRERHDHTQEHGAIWHAAAFVGGSLLTTVIASFAVAPFGIFHFHNTQLYAMVANLVAIPICNIVVMPSALAVLLALPLGLEAWPLWLMGFGIDGMTAVAQYVAVLPGSVAKTIAIPTVSFALMLVGGLWLLLWLRPWRILGLVPIAAGVLVSPTLARPDILVGRDGTTLGVRDVSGKLSVLASRGSAFEITRWLENDGDRRTAKDASDARAFACDPLGCSAQVKGVRVVVSATPAAARDDCPVVGVLILKYPRPRGCGAAGAHVLDPAVLRSGGVHALYAEPGGVRVETVAAIRGQRPWSRLADPAAYREAAAGASAGVNRLAGFAGLERRFRDEEPAADIDRGRAFNDDPE
jgi:competence protein ComEC